MHCSGMPRTHRSHLPGAVFHLTARTQGHEPWFTGDVRDRIVEFTASVLRVSDYSLLAYAVMSNHLHLLVRQGESRLDRVMQPLLRRIALVVQRTHGLTGHVFERRFRDHVCHDADHTRATIAYIHLNPVRAGLATEPGAYRWTSHSIYVGHSEPTVMTGALGVEHALGLFAPREGLRTEELRRAYRRYVGWRVRYDRHRAAQRGGAVGGPPPPRPPVRAGDIHWAATFGSGVVCPAGGENGRRAPRPDLHSIARRTLAELAPDLDLERIRSPYKGRAAARARRAMVERMSDAGHSGRAVAQYLRVSDQCVSKILAARRYRSVSAGRDM